MGKGGAVNRKQQIFNEEPPARTTEDAERVLERCWIGFAKANEEAPEVFDEAVQLLKDFGVLKDGEDLASLKNNPEALECVRVGMRNGMQSLSKTLIKPLGPRKYAQLYSAVEELALRSNIEMPALLVYKDSEPVCQARAAFNSDYTKLAIYISERALNVLTERELIGVLSHEVGHITNSDLWSLSYLRTAFNSWLGNRGFLKALEVRTQLDTCFLSLSRAIENRADLHTAKIGRGRELALGLGAIATHMLNSQSKVLSAGSWNDDEATLSHPHFSNRVALLSKRVNNET